MGDDAAGQGVTSVARNSPLPTLTQAMPAVDDPEALPFPAGRSPFHVKGVTYLGHVEYATSHIPGGERAVVEAMHDPALRAFFEQKFLAASWYDVLPMVPVWHACAKLLGQNPTDFLRERTRHQATRDIHGIYRFILKLASAQAVALRVPRIMQQYFDFGATSSSVVGPGLVRITVSGVPEPIVAWLRIVGETYLQVALELAGVTFAQLRRMPVTPAGEAHGVRLASVGFDIQLDPKKGD
jgi:hypothetical protein